MKAFAKLFLVFFLIVFLQINVSAQQETITWALTADGTASSSSNVTAANVSVGPGLTELGPSSYGPNGVQTTGWNKSNTIQTDDYFQYSITTPSSKTFTVDRIQLTFAEVAGSSWIYRLSYSTNSDFTSASTPVINTASGTVTVSFTPTINLPVNTTLFIRFYGVSNSGNPSTLSDRILANRNFSVRGTGAAASTLPVTLSSFTAKQTTDNKVSLAWVTSSESVNKGFSIERQEEGSGKFQSLGFITSKAEGGNSQSTLAYSFKDVTAKNGANLYRLVQEDLDGKKTYSEVRVVKLSAQSVSNVFPNPSNGAINISRTNDGKKMNIQVLDQSGRVINQVNNITDANYRMNLPQSGIYSIKMMYPETGERSTQRIVVHK